jgi:hypothetical protein
LLEVTFLLNRVENSSCFERNKSKLMRPNDDRSDALNNELMQLTQKFSHDVKFETLEKTEIYPFFGL